VICAGEYDGEIRLREDVVRAGLASLQQQEKLGILTLARWTSFCSKGSAASAKRERSTAKRLIGRAGGVVLNGEAKPMSWRVCHSAINEVLERAARIKLPEIAWTSA